jgi:hypothetical protein
MRLAFLPLVALLAACAPHATVQPPAPAPTQTYGLPGPAGVTCTPVWVGMKSSAVIFEYDYECPGWSPTGVVKEVGAGWNGMAWNVSTSKWVTVATNASLSDAQAAVVGYLGRTK